MPDLHGANLVPENIASFKDYSAQILTIREEMRFEIGIFHERINALISAEAFLLISFTMALTYTGRGTSSLFFWISHTLSAVGFILAALAWPGVATSYKIIVEWNIMLMSALKAGHAASTVQWRPSVFMDGDRRIQADHRRGMLFSRFVPAIFIIAWTLLASIVIFAH